MKEDEPERFENQCRLQSLRFKVIEVQPISMDALRSQLDVAPH